LNNQGFGAHLKFTAYIDAIEHGAFNRSPEIRRPPPGTQRHLNYYQTHDGTAAGGAVNLLGGPTNNTPPADNIRVSGQGGLGWVDGNGNLLTHFTIDNDDRVKSGVVSTLISEINQP
jgi:hypothetical protein